MIEPAKAIAEYNPLSFIVEGMRDPIISGDRRRPTLGDARAGDRRDRRARPRAQRPRPAPPAEGGLMDVGRRPAGVARQPGDDRGADGARQERAAAGARGGDPGRAGADDLLPRPQRRVRRADPAERASTPAATRASSSRSACSRAPASPAPPPASTSPATSSRAGSTACSSPPPRAGSCSPARCSPPAPGR